MKRYSRPTARSQDATHLAVLTQITSTDDDFRPMRHRSTARMQSVWLHTYGTHALGFSLSIGPQLADANVSSVP